MNAVHPQPRPPLSNRDLAFEVRTHGGILGAIEYGIGSDAIEDPEVANAWRETEVRYRELRPALSVIGRVLAKSRAP